MVHSGRIPEDNRRIALGHRGEKGSNSLPLLGYQAFEREVERKENKQDRVTAGADLALACGPKPN
jgi:hypothetical protein